MSTDDQQEGCRNDCVESLSFPRKLENRPGLSHIAYRIGTYSDFREFLLRRLDREAVLAAWTHRGADDPGIALLEGASILGDILTFYQELYANEAYLRTAQWRESIADLVRLLGYHLSPGVGGKATFAFGVKGTNPVVIPAGFSIKAQLEGLEQQQDFQSTVETIAYPHLSQFHFYRPRRNLQAIAAGINRLEVESVNGLKDISSVDALGLKKGDRLILLPDNNPFEGTGISDSFLPPAEILTISKVEKVLDRTIIEFEGSLVQNRETTITAYRLGRSFKHFGHNAPALTNSIEDATQTVTQTSTINSQTVTLSTNSTTQKTIQTPTDFWRNIYTTHEPKPPGKNYYSSLKEIDMPLAQELNDLATGNKIICQGYFAFSNSIPFTFFDYILFAFYNGIPFTLVKEIKSLRADANVWGNLSGFSTVLTLNSRLITNNDLATSLPLTDIRRLEFHEVKSPVMTLRAASKWDDGAFNTDTPLNFFGTYEQVLALSDRTLILQRNEATQTVKVTNSTSSFSLTNRDKVNPWLWSVTLNPTPIYQQEDFDEQYPKVTVYGNLVEANQGKTEQEAVLGNGDSRQLFQTFKLPKSPLTYFNSNSETPPEVPELQIYVSDRLWQRVSSLFNRKPSEEIYIVREDANGDSWVQFGDGKTGARLPSGLNNVVAKYRTGIGAFGAIKTDTTVQGGKLDRLDKIWLPGIATGGEPPEIGDKARDAAPGKIQSLGRLVSLKDFESETLAISGVYKVSATWELIHQIPTVVLTVLIERGREKEIDEIRQILNTYNRCRGAQRFSIHVRPGKLQYIYLDVTVGINPTFREELIKKAVKAALGVMGEEGNGIDGSAGLFGIRQRQFGQPEYATRIAGTIQNIEGIVWVKVNYFDSLGLTENPSDLSVPSPKQSSPVVACNSDEILSLYKEPHLQLSLTATVSKEVC